MSEWIQVAGYAEDLQAAYDYFRTRGGHVATEQFFAVAEWLDEIVASPAKLEPNAKRPPRPERKF